MIPLGRNTRKHGGTTACPGSPLGAVNEITFALVSGAVCHVTGLAVIGFPESSKYVLTLMSGGTRSAAVPYGSESCQEFSQIGVQLFVQTVSRLCCAQLMEPSDRFQPSPTQGAA